MRIPTCILVFSLAATLPAAAQTAAAPHAVELALTFTADRTNLVPGQYFWLAGGAADAAIPLTHGFSAALSFSGLHSSSISSTAVPLSLITFTAGPRYSHNLPAHHLTLYGQFLAGTTHGFDSLFPSTSGATSSASGLALQTGGGLNLALQRRLSFRVVEAGWLRTQLPNGGTGAQNHLLLSTGLVVHF